MMVNRGPATLIHGDGKQQLMEDLEELLDHGFGRLEVVVRDGRIHSTATQKQRVRIEERRPKHKGGEPPWKNRQA